MPKGNNGQCWLYRAQRTVQISLVFRATVVSVLIPISIFFSVFAAFFRIKQFSRKFKFESGKIWTRKKELVLVNERWTKFSTLSVLFINGITFFSFCFEDLAKQKKVPFCFKCFYIYLTFANRRGKKGKTGRKFFFVFVERTYIIIITLLKYRISGPENGRSKDVEWMVRQQRWRFVLMENR